MKFPKLTLALLGFQFFGDTVLTGGVSTLLTLGLPSDVFKSIKKNLDNILSGVISNQIINSGEKFMESSLDEALEKAFSITLASIKQDFLNNKDYHIKLRQRIYYWLEDGVPSEELLNQNFLDQYFLNPLLEALKNEIFLKNIIRENKHLKPGRLMVEALNAIEIHLPPYQAEKQEKIRQFLIQEFNERLLHHFNNELLKNKIAQKAYHTHLLHWTVGILEKQEFSQNEIQQSLKTLLNFAKWEKIQMGDVIHGQQLLAENQQEIKEKIQNLSMDFLNSKKLLLTFYKNKRNHFKDQFKYESLYTDFVGRENELKMFWNFLSEDRNFSWLMLSGEGGTGKSRLANEICIRGGDLGWEAGFSKLDHNKNFNWETFDPHNDTLIVFDYVKERATEIERILGILVFINFKFKVRLLLLDRQFDNELSGKLANSTTRYSYYNYEDNLDEKAYHLCYLGNDARWRIIMQMVTGSKFERVVLSNKDELLNQLDQQDPLKRPLFAFFSGVALAEGMEIKNWNIKDNLKYHIKRQEEKIWSKMLIWENHKADIKNLIWLATIAEYLNYEDLLEIREKYGLLNFELDKNGQLLERDFSQVRQLFMSIQENKNEFDQVDYLGIKPDLLGEFFIVSYLEEILGEKRQTNQASSLMQAAWEIRSERTWSMTYLTIENFGEKWVVDWMVNWIDNFEPLKHGNIIGHIGDLFFRIGRLNHFLDIKKAGNYYKKSIKKGNIPSITNLGMLYQEEGNFRMAKKLFLNAINKGDGNANYNLAILYQIIKQDDKAKVLYKEAIKYGNVSAMVNLGVLCSKEGEVNNAKKLYQNAIDKGHLGAIHNLAIIYQEEGTPEKAKELYSKASEKGVSNSMYNLAQLYEREGNQDEAIRLFLKAVDKGHSDAMNALALIYQNADQLDKAKELFLRAIQKGNSDSMFNLALLLEREGQIEEAKELHQNATKKGNVDSMYNLALILAAHVHIEEAKEQYQNAIKKGSVNSMFNLGDLYQKEGNYRFAKKFYHQAAEKKDPKALNSVAILYMMEGNLKNAKKYYLKAIRKGNISAMFNLAILFQNEKNFEKAEKYYLLAIDNKYVDAMFNLSALYYNLNLKKNSAGKLIERSLSSEERNINEKIDGIIISAWANIIYFKQNRDKLLKELIEVSDIFLLEKYFWNILIHNHSDYVFMHFFNGPYASSLKENLPNIYFVTVFMINPNHSILKGLPKEILKEIIGLTKLIIEKKAFFSN